MRAGCAICKELYVPNSVVVVISCGHLFHGTCISKWLKRNVSCPQCRSIVNQRTNKVYLHFEQFNDDDPTSLKNQLIQTKYELKKLRLQWNTWSNFFNYTSKSCDKWRARALESKTNLTISESMLLKIKEENLNLRETRERYKSTLKELSKCKKKLNTFLSLESMIEGSLDEVRGIVNSTPVTRKSVRQLATYVEVLKKQNKKDELKYKRLYNQHQDLNFKFVRLNGSFQLLKFQNEQKLDVDALGESTHLKSAPTSEEVAEL